MEPLLNLGPAGGTRKLLGSLTMNGPLERYHLEKIPKKSIFTSFSLSGDTNQESSRSKSGRLHFLCSDLKTCQPRIVDLDLTLIRVRTSPRTDANLCSAAGP